MEPFTRTLAVRLMNQEDSHSVKRRGTPNFNIFIWSPVRRTVVQPTKVEESSNGGFETRHLCSPNFINDMQFYLIFMFTFSVILPERLYHL